MRTSESAVRSVWIVNHYAPHPKKQGKIGLHLQLAREMANVGWNVNIITASTSHPTGSQFLARGVTAEVTQWENTESLFVRSRSYTGNGLSRLLNMGEFGLRVFQQRTVKQLPTPRVIIGRITNPLAAIAALRWSRYYEVPFILEISDIWPETFVQLGAMTENDPRTKILGKIEKQLIRASTAVMSPLPGIGDYLKDNGFTDKQFYWIPNGVDVSRMTIGQAKSDSADRPFRITYVGSLGNANAVDTILRAFDSYVRQTNDSQTELEIIGSGPLLSDLQNQSHKLTSGKQILFSGRVPHSDVPKRLGAADALIANMKDLPLYRYGIALNKIFDYLLSARPIIFATNARNNLVEEAQAGITVEADDEIAIAAGIKEMIDRDPKERLEWGLAGRDFVIENYSYKHSADKFLRMLESIA